MEISITTDAMVMAEARRIARSRVRDHLRKSGVRISLVEQVEIHKAVSLLMQYCGEEFIAEARAQLTAPYPNSVKSDPPQHRRNPTKAHQC